MAKLSEAQAYALRLLRGDGLERQTIRHLTRVALLRKGAMRQVPPGRFQITPTGLALLAEHEAAEASPAPAAGPTVRLSPAPSAERQTRHHARVPDANLLQLLALLDGGARITRKLYQTWRVTGADPFPLDPARLDDAAHAAVFFGLAVAGEVSGTYTLRAEPVHLERTDGETVCKRRIRRAGRLRLRYTTDPAKVTHDRCAKA